MNFTPVSYNNRTNIKNNIPRQPRQSEGIINNYSNQYSNIQSTKNYEQWNRNEQTSIKTNSIKSYNSMQTGYGRVMTQGNIPSNNSKPITPIQSTITNYNQPHQVSPMVYQVNQNNKFTNNQLFKSSIYGGTQNGNNSVNNDRFNLNNSGGGKITNYNITPPRKLPRVSQPLLPSNSQIPYLNGDFYKHSSSTNHTLDSPFYSSQKQTSFTKTKPFNIDNSIKQQENNQTKDKISRQIPIFIAQKYGRKNSLQVDIFKPIMNSNQKRKVSLDDFIEIRQLGSGKYGRVLLVKQKYSGFICALKIIEKKLLNQQQITQQFIRQLKIQIYLYHPNIIKMYGYFDDKQHIYTILEVATGGQLFHMLQKSQSLSEIKVAGIMRQVCDAVSSIHSLRIIHRDIKPQNIVLHDGVIKLCDFGWSVHQDKNLRTTFCGTPLYVCPQILKGKQYDEKIDVWSLGIMMYEMLIGQNPFRITKQEQLIKIIKDQINIPTYANLTKQAKDFLDKCLKKNPNQRCTMRQLCEHQFFKKYPEKQSQKKMMKLD